MNENHTLELALKDILCVINPLRDDWSTRIQIIDELRAIIQSLESLRGATVEPFGSFVSNLFTRWGDLDISIELPNGSYISSAGKKRKQTLLKEVMRALRRKGGWRKLQFIGNAKVPILKLESYYHNISCDISINNLTGQMKSKLLYWINEIDGRFRDMVLLVKEWAKARGINDPKSGSLNSYTLSLLVIFHFQSCVPALLPPLKEIYPGNLVDDLTGVRAVAERRIEEICAVNLARFKNDRSRMVNTSSLSELFTSFLARFSCISLRASQEGICPYTGQWEDIQSNMKWLPKTYELFVEDPFEQPVNVARTVSSGQLPRILEAFDTTHRSLISSNQNRTSLALSLAGPQVSSLVARTSVGNPPESSRGYQMSHSEVPRYVRSPSQAQRQFHNTTRPGSRPNSVTANRPSLVFESPGQQSWRPRSDR